MKLETEHSADNTPRLDFASREADNDLSSVDGNPGGVPFSKGNTMTLDGVHWFKFFFRIWLSDVELRNCSPGARGLLIDLMSLAADGHPYGHLASNHGAHTEQTLCKALAYPWQTMRKLLAELDEWGRVCRTDDGVIFIPRMVKDYAYLQQQQAHGAKGAQKRYADTPKPPLKGSPKAPLKAEVEVDIEVEVEGEADSDQLSSLDANLEVLKDVWNKMATDNGLARITTWSKKRRTAVRQRMKENQEWITDAIDAVQRIPQDPFRLGNKPGKDWKANIKWFLYPDTVAELLEEPEPEPEQEAPF